MGISQPPLIQDTVLSVTPKKEKNTILGYVLIIDLFRPHTIYNCEGLARVLIEQLENLLPKIVHQIQVGRGKTVLENPTRYNILHLAFYCRGGRALHGAGVR